MVLRTPVGGLYRHVIDLTDALGARGHAVGLVMDSLTSDAQTDQRLNALTHPPALGVFRTPMPRLLGAGDITANFVVRKLAKKHAVQILHGHGAKGGFNARLARIGTSRRVALYTPHGGVLNYKPDQFSGRIMRWIEARLLPHTDGVIFESVHAQKTFEAEIAPVPCLRPVVHNGLNDAEFEPLPDNSIAHDFAYVGELSVAKGLTHLFDALAGFKRADGQAVRLIVGGGGRDVQALKDHARQLGITDQLNFVGVMPAREVFAQAHCVILPSLAESLPYVVLEAAAAMKPVIATNVGGVHEIFGPTADKLVPPANTEALRKAMQTVLDDPVAARQEAEIRNRFVRDNFNIAKMAEEIIATYRQALAGR